MPSEKDIKTFPPSDNFFNNLLMRVKLILRLMADARISPWLKILPIGSALYFLLPDIAPGPIDDIAVVWLGAYLFIELCPSEIVQEHIDMISQAIPGSWEEIDIHEQNHDQVVDGEIRDM